MSEDAFWGKIYEKTFTGSMYGAGPVVFAVWAYAIAYMRPPNGKVELNPRMLAGIIGCPPDDVASAIKMLCAPDADSRTTIQEGKRLIKVGQFEYTAVNFSQYRSGRQPDERKDQNREAQARFRERNPTNKPPSAVVSLSRTRPEALIQAPPTSELPASRLPAQRQASFAGDETEGQIPARAIVPLAEGFQLPEAWGNDAEALGWSNGAILKEAEKFRQYWFAGKGAGKRKSVKGWRQAWSNWLSKAEAK